MTHLPVLLHEVLNMLAPRPGEFIIDGTLDGGGHASEILARLGNRGKFLGLDLDLRMIGSFRSKAALRKDIGEVFLACENFARTFEVVKRLDLPKADGLLLDLGFSSLQLGDDERPGIGISFLRNEPLSMTYSATAKPMSELLQDISEENLAEIIKDYSGERYSREIARVICERRPIRTTFDLVKAVESAVPKGYERGRIHKATRTFQALRVFANDELGNITAILGELLQFVARGGRVAIISFHSIEDGIVKRAFREMARAGTARLLSKKPITPSREESSINVRSRSAKLRGIQIV